MLRLIMAVLLTALGVSFSVANTHHVALRYLVGEPVRVRLIFLLGTTFLAGVLFTSFAMLVRRAQVKRRQSRDLPPPEDDDLIMAE